MMRLLDMKATDNFSDATELDDKGSESSLLVSSIERYMSNSHPARSTRFGSTSEPKDTHSRTICAGFDESCPGYMNESARFQRPTTPVVASSVQRGIHPEAHFRARTPAPPSSGTTDR